MGIRWNICHADRLATAKADGVVTLKDGEAYLDALVVNGAMPYRKLFDCSTMHPDASDDEMMLLGARMQAYIATLKGGPLAIVATRPHVNDYVRRYLNLATGATRPVKIFSNVGLANRWLDTVKG